MSASNSPSNRPLSLGRVPAGLRPWMEWAERSLRAIARRAGVNIEIDGAESASRSVDGTLNFKLKSGANASDHAWKFRAEGGTGFTLTSGHVNSIIPSNMTATFTASTAGKFVWVKATLDAYGSITALILESNDTPPAPSTAWFNAESPPEFAYYPLVKITSASGTITKIEQICSSNLSLDRTTSAVGCALNEYMLAWRENSAS